MLAPEAPTELLWDVILKTALVLAVLYGVLWAIRRSSGKMGPALHRGPTVTVIQTAHLGPGRSLHVIGVGPRTLLVGATSQQVSLLIDLGTSESEGVLEGKEEVTSFEHYLSQAVGIVNSVSSRLKGRRE